MPAVVIVGSPLLASVMGRSSSRVELREARKQLQTLAFRVLRGGSAFSSYSYFRLRNCGAYWRPPPAKRNNGRDSRSSSADSRRFALPDPLPVTLPVTPPLRWRTIVGSMNKRAHERRRRRE